jgi:hypothetical protein
MEGTGVDIPGKASNKRHERVQVPSPNREDNSNSANEHHPETQDILQTLDMRMGFVVSCERSWKELLWHRVEAGEGMETGK